MLVTGWLAKGSEGSIDEPPDPVPPQSGSSSHGAAKPPEPLVVVETGVPREEPPEIVDDMPHDIEVYRRQVSWRTAKQAVQPHETVGIRLPRGQEGHSEVSRRPVTQAIPYFGETEGPNEASELRDSESAR